MPWAKKNLGFVSSIWGFGESRKWVYMDIYVWSSTLGIFSRSLPLCPSTLSAISLFNQRRVVDWRERLWKEKNENKRIIVSQESDSLVKLWDNIDCRTKNIIDFQRWIIQILKLKSFVVFWNMKNKYRRYFISHWKDEKIEVPIRYLTYLKVVQLIWAIIWS